MERQRDWLYSECFISPQCWTHSYTAPYYCLMTSMLLLGCVKLGTHGRTIGLICRYAANHNDKSAALSHYARSRGRERHRPVGITYRSIPRYCHRYRGTELAAQRHRSRPRVHNGRCVLTTSDVVKTEKKAEKWNIFL